MKLTDGSRILIAGGGIAGLALARALHQQNIPALTLEQRLGALDAGLALNLPGNAIRALTDLGVGDELRNLGSPVSRREYRNQRDRVLFTVDEDEFWGDEARPRCVRRSDLISLLGRGLPADAIRHDSAIIAIRQGGQHVEVELTSGSTESGGLLVGADGVHSTVRRAIFGDQIPEAATLSDASWRFMAPNPGITCWTVWTGALGMFLLIPVDRGEVYGWAAATRGQRSSKDFASMHSVFDAFPEPVRQTFAAVLAVPHSTYYSPLEEVRLSKWSRDRVLLIGDAAHATAPVWAQGAALAMEDALVLARVAAAVKDWGQVGIEYERQRRQRVMHVQAMTDRLSRAARLPSWIRDLLMPIVVPRSYQATYGPLRTPVGS